MSLLYQQGCVVSDCVPDDLVSDYILRYTLQDSLPEPVIPPQTDACLVVGCAPDDDIAAYNGAYNLQSLVPYTSTPPGGAVPIGGGYYIAVPPVTVYVPPGPGPSQFSLQTQNFSCPAGTTAASACNYNYTYQIPGGSTPAQVQAIVNQAATEVAVLKAQCCVGLPQSGVLAPPTTYYSNPASANCGAGQSIKQVGALPPYVSVTGNGVVVAAGTFTSTTSQADADSQAQFAADEAFDGGNVECGWYNTDQQVACPDGKTSDVPAGTVFSTVSQADANAQALAQANINCAGLMIGGWTWTPADSTPPTNGAIRSASGSNNAGSASAQSPVPPPGLLAQVNSTLRGEWVNTCPGGSSAILVTVVYTYNVTPAFAGGGGGGTYFIIGNSGGAQSSHGDSSHPLTGSSVITDQTISVSPGQTFYVQLQYGGTANSNGGFLTSVNVSMYCRFTC